MFIGRESVPVQIKLGRIVLANPLADHKEFREIGMRRREKRHMSGADSVEKHALR